MTTIVVTANEILHDTQATVGNVRQLWEDEEKTVVVDGKVFCGAGDFDAVEALPAWLKDGGDPDKAPGGDWAVLVISRERGKVRARFYDDTQKRGSWVPLPTAIGSGSEFVMTVLKYQQMKGMATDVLDAINVACAMDIYSGGTIKRLKIDDLLTPPKARVPRAPRKPKVKVPFDEPIHPNRIPPNAQGQ